MHFFFDFSILSWHFGLPVSLNEVQTHFGCLNSFCGDGRLPCRSSDIHSVPVAILSLIVKAQGVPILVLICTTWNPVTIWYDVKLLGELLSFSSPMILSLLHRIAEHEGTQMPIRQSS